MFTNTKKSVKTSLQSFKLHSVPSCFSYFMSDELTEMERTIILSVSGGETSMLMAALMKQTLPFHNIICIFSNTGCENNETLEFVEQCDKAFGLNVVWIEAVTNPIHGKGVTHRVTNFTDAFRLDQYKHPDHPFHAHIRKNGIPNMARPQCSDRLKENAIEHYKKTHGLKGCSHSLGMRDDEPLRTMPKAIRTILANTDVTPDTFKRMEHQHRLNAFTSSGFDYSEEELKKVTNYSKKLRKYNLVYVLADAWKIDKEDVISFWESQPFRLNLEEHQGNCSTCWKKSQPKLFLIAHEAPAKFDAFAWFEAQYQHVKPLETGPASFFRGHKSANMIIGESRTYDLYMLEMMVKKKTSKDDGCGSSCNGYNLEAA